jgi:hypothetical protein
MVKKLSSQIKVEKKTFIMIPCTMGNLRLQRISLVDTIVDEHSQKYRLIIRYTDKNFMIQAIGQSVITGVIGSHRKNFIQKVLAHLMPMVEQR